MLGKCLLFRVVVAALVEKRKCQASPAKSASFRGSSVASPRSTVPAKLRASSMLSNVGGCWMRSAATGRCSVAASSAAGDRADRDCDLLLSMDPAGTYDTSRDGAQAAGRNLIAIFSGAQPGRELVGVRVRIMNNLNWSCPIDCWMFKHELGLPLCASVMSMSWA